MARQLRAERAAEQASQQAPVQRQERREPPKKRQSRGAATAQQHRDERRERARLDSLRDKQKRKARQSRHRRISPDTWKRIIIMGGVCLAAVLSMVIFFRVRNVRVEGAGYVGADDSQTAAAGSSYYSADEVIDAAGITMGDNLLTLSRGEIAGNVLAKLNMVKEVRVTRRLPDTVVLHITEYEVTFAVQDTSGAYYTVTASGVTGKKLTEREVSQHIIVEGLTILPPTEGEQIQLFSEQGMEEDGQTQRNVLLKVFGEIEASGLSKYVGRLQVPSAYQIVLWYGERKNGLFDERFEVRLGGSDELAYKLEYLKAVVAEQKDFASGVIDLSFHDGKEAHVILND